MDFAGGFRRVCGLGALAALAACSRRESRTAAAGSDTPVASTKPADSASAGVMLEVPESRAGHLLLASEGLVFIPCDSSGQRMTIADLPDGEGAALVKEFQGGTAGIPVLVRLNGAKLTGIRYAAPGRQDCSQIRTPDVVEARGNEPFWAVEVYGDSARLRVPLVTSGYLFTGGAWRRLSSGEWVYEARRTQNGSDEFLVLKLTDTRCSDSMSGARYPFRAELVRDGEPASGCAVEGRLARRDQALDRPMRTGSSFPLRAIAVAD